MKEKKRECFLIDEKAAMSTKLESEKSTWQTGTVKMVPSVMAFLLRVAVEYMVEISAGCCLLYFSVAARG